ncbi:Permease of the drug/metabolite transporter (DMT) superfamily [Caminicella sporogenes DSM 14501]|uniref:Permease of the drug/metabolite transporter (DMT) superfamily n=1 Tax=Caminicella sporogenes DSM 14501 TaxID=1121266 RepID=A0A1M6TIF5_9FIRM|nr:DMT family transporter [Caminicella sporogenes]SHK56689.1 Permease of the drug/metabolite transporter (DMT) superfamily [Caminicella sporogenes DSM 14501]
MGNKTKVMPLIAIIGTSFIWGLSFLSIKVAIGVLPPMTLALSRFVIASILLTILFKIKEKNVKIKKGDIPIMALAGFLGVTVYFYFENNGIKLIPASNAAIIIAAIPIFTLIFETIVFKTKMTFKKIASVIISLIGVYFIVGARIEGVSTKDAWIGYLMMFGAVLAWVVYTLITKPLFKKYSQLSIVYYQTLFGTVFLLPFALFEKTNWGLVNNIIILNVVYLGAFCSALGYYLYIYAMNYIGISTASLFLNLIPVVATIGGYFILDEKIGFSQIFGGSLVIFAVYLISWNESVDSNLDETEPLIID